jgi:hypothetical protein
VGDGEKPVYKCRLTNEYYGSSIGDCEVLLDTDSSAKQLTHDLAIRPIPEL